MVERSAARASPPTSPEHILRVPLTRRGATLGAMGTSDINVDKMSGGVLEVTGEGQVKARPDRASVRLAVITEAKSAKQAVDDNAKLANAVIDAIVALGVPKSALSTQGLSVGPIYNYDENLRTSVIVGYQATDAIAADVEITRAGEVYDAGVGAGANQSSGISFHLADERPLRKVALEAAVAAAQADAATVAAASGVKLHGPEEITVESGGGPIIRTAESLAKNATPVLPGQLTVSARVRIKYAIG